MKTYFIKTFGCQANEADSERIAALYQKKGYQPAENLEQADVVIINTCSVRQSAEHRVGGLLSNIKYQISNIKKTNKKSKKIKPKIVLAGCMLRYGISDLMRRYPQIDEFLRVEEVGFDLQPLREDRKEALVPIMEGCNNFCSYCVVPYARGREKSRPFEGIICEVEKLVKQGYREITLIGQNVNAYGKDLEIANIKKQISKIQIKNQKEIVRKYRTPFALLLAVLDKIPKLKKVSFLTSNPWDLTDEIIQSMKLPKIDRYLHLPVQSGDDEILKKMNRPYTASQYISLINKIRERIPEIKIGTDIIVGFPGETKEQFENTVKLCKKANFEKVYISKYSPRPGTVAFKLKDDVSPLEKKRRWRILEELVNK